MAGLGFEKARQYRRAEQAYEQAIQHDNRFDKWVYRRALMLFRLGRPLDALNELDGHIEVHYASSPRLARLRGIIAVLEQTGTALEHAHYGEDQLQLLALQAGQSALHPDDSDLLVWGLAFDISGDQDRARANYLKFMESPGPAADRAFCRHRLIELGSDLRADDIPDDLTAASIAAAGGPDVEFPFGRPRSNEWSVTACVLESAIAMDPDPDPNRLFQLGIAHGYLERYDAAEASYARATELCPTNAPYWRRRAANLVRLGDTQGAIECFRTSIVLQPAAGLFRSLASLYEQTGQWAEAEAAHHQASLYHPSGDSPSTRHLLRLYRRREEWPAVVALYESICSATSKPADWFQLGYARERSGDLVGAQQAYTKAVASQPRADWYFRLGLVTERSGAPTLRADSTLGLIRDPKADKGASIQWYEKAIELDPTDARTWSRLGMAYSAVNMLDKAISALENATQLEPNEWRFHHRLGRLQSEQANRRGAHLEAEYDLLEASWSRAIELAPYQPAPRQQLARSSTKASRWQQASQAAWPPHLAVEAGSAAETLVTYLERGPGEPDLAAVSHALTLQADEIIETLPTEWLFPLHWRLLGDGAFSLGYQTKKLLAQSILQWASEQSSTSLPAVLQAAEAHLFLGQTLEAQRLVTPRARKYDDELAHSKLEKYRADIQLGQGDTAAYTSLGRRARGANTPASEQAFVELITGKTVAIVGPGLSPIEHGAEIDGFDTVIRTKYVTTNDYDLSAITGRRTDISYYTLSGTHFLGPEIATALSTGDLKMAVFRTAAHTPETPYLTRDGDLRYTPSEYTLNLRAAQFAIQRICYDILRYLPANIKVFNSDFFTGQETYVPGYLQDYSAREDGVARTLPGFGHDYLADFEFTKALASHQLIEVDDTVRGLLDMTGSEYLLALDRLAAT